MEHRNLGKTGLKVSPLCLGTMQFGWTANEETSLGILTRAVELGINFIDTADVYSRWAAGNPGGIAASVTASGSWFQTIFERVMNPLSSTMYALLAFYVASASYRAFRAKNREATILLVAAFVILLGRTPFGTMITAWIPDSLSALQVPNMAIWIMSSPNLAGQRAIMIGIGLGVVSMSLRVLLGIERTYLGEDKG